MKIIRNAVNKEIQSAKSIRAIQIDAIAHKMDFNIDVLMESIRERACIGYTFQIIESLAPVYVEIFKELGYKITSVDESPYSDAYIIEW